MPDDKATVLRINDLTPDDIIVVLVGLTGAGKSTFIDVATRQNGETVSHGLGSGTAKIRMVRFPHPDTKQSIVLVDTPGFNDAPGSEGRAIPALSNWLKRLNNSSSCKTPIRIAGMLYLHRINDNRVTVPASKCLNALDGIAQHHSACRGAAVALCTTMWACLKDEGVGAAREDEFRKQHWGPAVAAKRAAASSRQTPCLRFRDSFESAWSVLDDVLASRSLPSSGYVAQILSATARAESDADTEDGISERDDANLELDEKESRRGAESDESERDEESDDFVLLDGGAHIPSQLQLFDKPESAASKPLSASAETYKSVIHLKFCRFTIQTDLARAYALVVG